MNRLSTLTAWIAMTLVMAVGSAIAQQPTLRAQILGTWTLVSWDIIRSDGSKAAPLVGTGPKGILMFDPGGRFAMQIATERPKFAANNRLRGTAEENRDAVHGNIAYFGTFSVTEGERTITFQVERSSYPNQTGSAMKRPITITGDELRYVNPAPPIAGPTGGAGHFVWKRAN